MHGKTKVIMISGFDDEALKKKATSQGCFAFLEKPFSYRKVSELLDKALRKKRFRSVYPMRK